MYGFSSWKKAQKHFLKASYFKAVIHTEIVISFGSKLYLICCWQLVQH